MILKQDQSTKRYDRETRYAVKGSAEVLFHCGREHYEICDVSEKGLRLRGSRPPIVGLLGDIILKAEGIPRLKVSGRVAWRHEKEFGLEIAAPHQGLDSIIEKAACMLALRKEAPEVLVLSQGRRARAEARRHCLTTGKSLAVAITPLCAIEAIDSVSSAISTVFFEATEDGYEFAAFLRDHRPDIRRIMSFHRRNLVCIRALQAGVVDDLAREVEIRKRPIRRRLAPQIG